MYMYKFIWGSENKKKQNKSQKESVNGTRVAVTRRFPACIITRHVIIFILYKMIPFIYFLWFYSHLVNLKFEFPIEKDSK